MTKHSLSTQLKMFSAGDGTPLLRVTVVLGRSGAGKSALVEKILAGGAGARTAVVVAQPLGDHVGTDPDDPGRSLTRNGQVKGAARCILTAHALARGRIEHAHKTAGISPTCLLPTHFDTCV